MELRQKKVKYACISCRRPVRDNQHALLCDGCDRWQHRTCGTGITVEDYRKAHRSEQEIDWKCKECIQEILSINGCTTSSSESRESIVLSPHVVSSISFRQNVSEGVVLPPPAPFADSPGDTSKSPAATPVARNLSARDQDNQVHYPHLVDVSPEHVMSPLNNPLTSTKLTTSLDASGVSSQLEEFNYPDFENSYQDLSVVEPAPIDQELPGNSSAVDGHVRPMLPGLNELGASLSPIQDSAIADQSDNRQRADVSFNFNSHSFSEPIPVEEESIESEAPDASIAEVPVTFTVVEKGTKREKPLLVSSLGYTYTIKKVSRTTTTWWCSVRNSKVTCSATVSQRGPNFRPNGMEHAHPAEPGALLKAKIRVRVKDIAMERLLEGAGSIVDQVMIEETEKAPESSHVPNSSNIIRQVNRKRQKERPKEPRRLAFTVDEDYVGGGFLRKDIRVGDQRHLVFATQRQLQLLAKAKCWCVDATFKVVSAPFYQMFSIHAFLRKDGKTKQVPLVFVMMSAKRIPDYSQVLKGVLEILPTEPHVEEIITDFEAAIWRGVAEILPNVTMHGCNFHWTQCVYKKVREFGLQTTYARKDNVYRYIKKLMALPFLPAEHMRPAFGELGKRMPPDGGIAKLYQYMESFWFRSSLWTEENWSVYRRVVRTNNDCEGWHRRFNVRARDNEHHFYSLVRLLKKEAKLVGLQARLVQQSQLRKYQRKQYRRLHGRVNALWDEYAGGKITASRLLRKVAAFNGPSTSDS